ncbi:MAG: hypothetical protein EXR79_02235 [Myxococcales bacterium]|nr:hypothetical protein [Myxococcales bacterium]
MVGSIGVRCGMVVLAPVLVLVLACGESVPAAKADAATEASASATTADASAGASPTYWGAVKPVLDRACTGCHAKGGIGPDEFDSLGAAKKHLAKAIQAIEAGRMPPWMPAPGCRRYKFERTLAAGDLAKLKAWQGAGMPEGDPKQTPAPVPGDGPVLVEPPTLELAMPLPYTATTAVQDDYRCFALGQPFAAETWLRASQVLPGDAGTVHHVLVFLVEPHQLGQIAALDTHEPGPGWTCYSGPGVTPPQTVAGWAPGGVPAVMRADTAIRFPQGSQLVMQVHYNSANHAPQPDRTRLQLWTLAKQPGQLLEIRALPYLGLAVPAGAKALKQVKLFTNQSKKPWTIVGVVGHMHTLGTRITLTHVVPASAGSTAGAAGPTGKETCLLDIPKWDFHWQQGYALRDGEEVTVLPGEGVRLDCTYDNSAENQPWVAGKQGAPKHVTWGEGTYDEMCLGYLSLVQPYTPYAAVSGKSCEKFQPCYDACKPGLNMTACALQCANQSSGGCTTCVAGALVGCAAGTGGCGAQAQGLLDCITGCQTHPDAKACVTQSCVPAIFAFDGCMAPVVQAGSCDGMLAGCGAKL